MTRRFPEGFLWGASTAAYQIEGAAVEDGRGRSIWDKFCRKPDAILNGDTGDVASDHYHRFGEDVELMRRLNLKAYRFSIAWPRVLPQGSGQVNKSGLDFYDRLVDSLVESEIEPWACLYHWDLPQVLEDKGGWLNRDMASRYADYAQLVVRRLGDRVRRIATFNSPDVAMLKGYGEGEHAPGIQGRKTALQALHHMNLAHGLGLQAMRAERSGLSLGNIYNLQPVEPLTDRPRDREAAEMLDALGNRSFPEPQILGCYPEPLADDVKPFVREGDLSSIAQKTDYFAFNHFTRLWAVHDPAHPFGVAAAPPPERRSRTVLGWEVAPEIFLAQLKGVKERYGDLPIYIAGNGAACADEVEPSGRVHDRDRIDYLRTYLTALHDALAAGIPVKGYFVWSLLDGFEWTRGYSARFGLVHVDHETLKRQVKDSFHFYAECAGQNGVDS